MTALVTLAVDPALLYRRGKVRDTLLLADGSLLMVSTDRISAFDVVLPTAIPDKGRVLNQMSRWWFAKTTHIVHNHVLPDDSSLLPADIDAAAVSGRAMRVRRAQRIDVECVARGYLAGSGWKEYRDVGTLAGERLPLGLGESARLPEPRFTPAAKNDSGHDENITRAQLVDAVGADMAARLETLTLELYHHAAGHAAQRGLLLADTKFEFGTADGELILIDEVLTPDSSRFWDAAIWREGAPQPAFDKQFVRDWLEMSGWDKQPPGPTLPPDVVGATRARYLEAARRLCDLDLTIAEVS